MVSCVCNCDFIIAATGLHANTAARCAIWQTRRASADCACPPIHMLAIVDIGFSTGVVVGSALFWGVPAAVACYLSSYGGGAGEVAHKQGLGTALPNKILIGTE